MTSSPGPRAAASRRLLWLPPALALALGILVLGFAVADQRHALDHAQRELQDHAASVAHLVEVATNQAAVAVELIYRVAEANLLASARLAALTPPDRLEGLEHVEVALRSADGAHFEGRWGSVPEERRGALVEEVLSRDPGELAEDGAPSQLGVYCLHLRETWGATLVCHPMHTLRHLRRSIGLGPLLRSLHRHGVHHVAIQDAGGILASTPDAGELSSWEQDAALGAAVATGAGLTFRRTAGAAGMLIEGLAPFALPDGTTAVLRVGVDAEGLQQLEASLHRRLSALAAMVTALLLLALGLTWLLHRWDLRERAVAARIATQEEVNRHWQAIGQMAATVAHEVRNPLNTLGMAAQRLQREFEIPAADRAEYDQLLGVLRSEAERVNRVVTEFLDLGRPLQLALAAVPLAQVVQEAVAPLQVRAQQEEKRLLIGPCEVGEVQVDRLRFVQILSNLIGNALDAVPPGGTVRIRSSGAARGWQLCVEDDGAGMDATALSRALEPFATTKRQGTGLGLPLAVRLVEAHGGTLRLRSQPGQGTEAVIDMPPSRPRGAEETP